MLKLEIENIFLKEVDSTQLQAKREAKNFSPDKITCVVADSQTKGYGRYQRPWISPHGFENLYCTFYFQLPLDFKNLTSISELLSYSIAELLIKKDFSPQFKWPNDILLSQKKLSGVLCETIFEKDKIQVFLGLGLNLNLPEEELAKVDQPATSLSVESQKKWDRNIFLKELESRFLKNLSLFFQQGFASFAIKIEKLLTHKNEPIIFYDGQNKYEGQIIAIKSDGALSFKLKATGEIKTFYSGDLLSSKKPKT